MGYRLFSQGAVASCWTLNHCQTLPRTMGASNLTLVGKICLWYARLTSLQHKSIFGHFWPPSPPLFSSSPPGTSPSSNLVLPAPCSPIASGIVGRDKGNYTRLCSCWLPLLAAGLWMLKIWEGESGNNFKCDGSVWKKAAYFHPLVFFLQSN